MSLGTDKIEAILVDVKDLFIVGKKVTDDGKVGVEDLQHVIALIVKLPKFVENFKAIGQAFEEGKDIDVAEIVKLIQKVHSLVKEIEAA